MDTYNLNHHLSENMNYSIAMSRRKKSRHTPKYRDGKRWGKENPPQGTDKSRNTAPPEPVVVQQQVLPPFKEEEKIIPILEPCQDLMVYSSARTWALLRAAGTDPVKIGLIHDNLEVYYRYTTLTPQGNWRRATIVGSTYEGIIGSTAVFVAEIKVCFPSTDHTYFVKEDRAGIGTIVFIDKKHKQPHIIPPFKA